MSFICKEDDTKIDFMNNVQFSYLIIKFAWTETLYLNSEFVCLNEAAF